MRMRNWCFTKYNLTVPEFDPAVVRYCVYQHEICPDTGREHLQGYVEFTKSIRLSAVKALFQDQTMHLEKRQGTRDQARDYCTKDESRKPDTEPIQFGTYETNPGARSDLNEVYELIKQGKRKAEILDAFPNVYMKYSNGIEKAISIYDNTLGMEKLHDEYDSCILRPWQEEVTLLLEGQNDRQVLWIYDAEGNHGKTFLGKYLLSKGAFYVTQGKSEDISYAYDFQSTVVFNMSRSSDYMPYTLMENLKDGTIFSPKYQSQLKICRTITKVLVMSNTLPKQDALSQDRWIIKTLSNNELT